MQHFCDRLLADKLLFINRLTSSDAMHRHGVLRVVRPMAPAISPTTRTCGRLDTRKSSNIWYTTLKFRLVDHAFTEWLEGSLDERIHARRQRLLSAMTHRIVRAFLLLRPSWSSRRFSFLINSMGRRPHATGSERSVRRVAFADRFGYRPVGSSFATGWIYREKL